ncbi:helix-turn-helix domain-containing protein [Erythrobacter sp. KY5]|uniref:helix-turn-helix domain-containing protein n=1 Tax=Erythrobacter sp. KY5 TaxID=2011159 RepID=UPI0021010C7E|nr:helix-turn-helix domain-containing protein [Erythrobacter sp. KY5]
MQEGNPTSGFDNVQFFEQLDLHRTEKGLTWKKAADAAGVSASTFTRIAQGRKPDVDTLSALCRWARLDANRFVLDEASRPARKPMNEALALFRADPNLSESGKVALEALVREAYKHFREGA